MKPLLLTTLCLATLLMFSCNNKGTSSNQLTSIDKTVNDFADLECRAMTLRENRFALANEIRFTQDTLLQDHAKDTARLKLNLERLNKDKETLYQSSVALADTIHHVLDSLMQQQLADAKDKTAFNQKLEDVLKQRGCLDQKEQQ